MPTDTTDYSTVTGTASVTVNKATPTVTAWSTASAISYGQTLASSTLTGGTASVAGSFAWTTSTTTPVLGTTSQSVTFMPTNNTDYNAATGTVSVAAILLDFAITSAGSTSQTVVPGKAASYNFSIAPQYGSYTDTVSFAASGLPTGATVSFSPATITATGGVQTVTMTIQTAATAAQNCKPSIGRKLVPLDLALLLLPLIGAKKLRRHGRRMSRWLCLLIFVGGMAASATLTGCGAGYFAQAAKDYTVTVTATSGSIQHSFNITLNVQ